MKRAVLLFAALALVMASCSNTFAPAAMSSDTTTAQTTAKVSANAVGNSIGVSVSSPVVASKNQQIAVTFSNVELSSADIAELDGEIAIYPLASPTNTATQVITRGTALSKGTPIVTFSSGDTIVTYTIDLSNAAISSYLEVAIVGNNFSVSGVQALNLDGDDIFGEANDDDFVDYITVNAGTVTPVTVAGLPRLPRNFVDTNAPTLTPTDLGTVGSTAITFSGFIDQDGVTLLGSATSLASVITVQKFDASSNAWVAASVGTPALSATGVFTINLSTAQVQGEVYRVSYGNFYSVTGAAAVAGYTHRLSYNNNQTSNGVSATFVSGTTADPAKQSSAVPTVDALTFDSSGYNGYVTLSYSDMGTLGISTSTVTTDNFKIVKVAPVTTVLTETYDSNWSNYASSTTTSGGGLVYQAVGSLQIGNSSLTSPKIYLFLPASQKQGSSVTTSSTTGWDYIYDSSGNYIIKRVTTTITPVTFSVAIGPGAIDLGSGSGSFNLGDATNVSNLPYLFTIVSGGSKYL